MASVREVRRKGGVAYEVRWAQDGRERQKTFTVKRAAERHAHSVETAQATGDSTMPLAGRGKTVAEVVADSLAASRPRLKPSTYLQYVNLYDTRILPTFGKQRLAAVTGQDVEAWIAALVAKGLSPSTIHNHYVALSKVFRYGIRHRLINYNPCEAVELPRQRSTEDFTPVFLTAKQVEAVAEEIGYPYDVLIRFSAYCGVRAAEVAGLRIRDLNLTAGHVEVRQTVKRVAGEWAIGTPKSARSTRNVPLVNRTLIADLKKLLIAHPDSGNPDALFWPAHANGSRRLDFSRPIDMGGVLRYYLRPALTRLGMPRMRFHDLRHTYASLMLAAGFKPYEVSRWMGHANVSTTDGIYGHLYPTDYNDQIAQFERFVAER